MSGVTSEQISAALDALIDMGDLNVHEVFGRLSVTAPEALVAAVSATVESQSRERSPYETRRTP